MFFFFHSKILNEDNGTNGLTKSPSGTNIVGILKNGSATIPNDNELINGKTIEEEPAWESKDEILELLPKDNDHSDDENETDKNNDDADDEDDEDIEEELNDVGDLMSNNPVSMTVNQLAPLSSISEVSLDKLDNGEQRK